MPKPAKTLVLCVHAHQPVGNFEHVFEEGYERAYKPFFDALERHPSIAVAFHISGSLLDWIERRRPEFIGVVARLAARGQVEILGGAYYEPVYGVIPERDLSGQIALMRARVKALFGAAPRGAWLTERVWDPALVGPLKRAGVEYTILDDDHLEKAGVAPPVTGLFRTRSGLDSLDLFAASKELRYLMPFRRPEDTVAFVKSLKTRSDDAVVFADDLEKFGMWPGTNDLVYKGGWLEKLFRLLESDAHIDTVTPSRARSHARPKRTVKVPHGSYGEMMEWCGGSFRNFFVKYDESRYMRDRMLSLSDAVGGARAKNGGAAKIEEARRALYRAQCNCTYWHGVFGGLYLHHLRSALFENLIQAESLLAEAGVTRPASGSFSRVDLGSGRRWALRQKDLAAFFNPRYGGALEELDYLPRAVNLLCSLQRRKEHYHDLVTKKAAGNGSGGAAAAIYAMLGQKEENLERHLHYDSYRRLSFLDRFTGAEIGADAFGRSSFREIGDFVSGEYRARTAGWFGARELKMERRGVLDLPGGRVPLVVSKSVRAKGDRALAVEYSLRNAGTRRADFTWGVELNFSIGDEASKSIERARVRGWSFRDAWRGISIRVQSTHEAALVTAPVETVSESEYGMERTYQGLAALFQRPLSLGPGETAGHAYELSVGP